MCLPVLAGCNGMGTCGEKGGHMGPPFRPYGFAVSIQREAGTNARNSGFNIFPAALRGSASMKEKASGTL